MTVASSVSVQEPFTHTQLSRLAGVFYLIIIACGVSADLILRAPLSGPGGLASFNENTFRLSLGTDLVMVLADVALALALFAQFQSVHAGVARIATVFRLMQAALIGASLIVLSALPGLVDAGEFALAAIVLDLHATGYDIGLAFFAVTSLAMAYLLAKRPAAPRWIAVGLALSAVVYLGGAFVRVLLPDATAVYAPAFIVPLVAETSFALWLLFSRKP